MMSEDKGPHSGEAAWQAGQDLEKQQSHHEEAGCDLPQDSEDEKTESEGDGDTTDRIEPVGSANVGDPTALKRWVSGGNHHTGEPLCSSEDGDVGHIPRAPLPLTRLDEGIVGWDHQDDPDMPLNFPSYKKWVIVGLLSAITFVTPFASSILAPGIGSLSKEFGNEDSTVGSMSVSIYLLGYCVGPLFLAPLSEMYGRRPIVCAANVFFCVWQMACALAPNMVSFIIFRFFCGIGGAGSLVGNILISIFRVNCCLLTRSQTIGPGVISDVFFTDDRGFAMGIFNLGPIIGKSCYPF